ncbi:MAG: ankyrin repeat domain-containing protein [Legionella sp.]|jgi:hypothetical protein
MVDNFISLMKVLDCPTNEGGNCWGIALSAEIARSNSSYEQFIMTMKFIAKLDPKTVRSSIDDAGYKSAIQFQELTPDEKMLLTIRPFFIQVYNYQNPLSLQLKLEVKGPYISQNDLKKTTELIRKDEGNTRLVSLDNYQRFLLFSEIKDGSRNLINFLDKIKSSTIEVGFLIGTESHVVHLFYDMNNSMWMLTSHSSLRSYRETTALVQSLMLIEFASRGSHIFCATLFLNELHEGSGLVNELNSLSENSLIKFRDGTTTDFVDSCGRTLLHIAAYNGLINVVNALFEQPLTKINQVDKKGATPLYTAAENGQLTLVNAFLNNPETEVNKTTNDGETPLFTAAKNGHLDVVDALIKHPKIEVCKANNKKQDPLYVAIQNRHDSVLKRLFAISEKETDKDINQKSVPLNIKESNSSSNNVNDGTKERQSQSNLLFFKNEPLLQVDLSVEQQEYKNISGFRTN